MKHEEGKKPCTTCGGNKVVAGTSAATSYDTLVDLGIPTAQAAYIVEMGIRASPTSDKESLLVLALAASAERYDAAVLALKEAEVELEKLSEELDEEVERGNTLLEALEGAHSEVRFDGEDPEEEEELP